MKVKTIEVEGFVYVREDCIGQYLTEKKWDEDYGTRQYTKFDLEKWIHDLYFENKQDFDNQIVGMISDDYMMVEFSFFEQNLKGYKVEKMLKILHKNGKLIKNSMKRNKHQTSINGKRANYIKIKLDESFKEIGIDNNE